MEKRSGRRRKESRKNIDIEKKECKGEKGKRAGWE